MADSTDQSDYTPEELAAFGNWVPLGALDPDLQPFLDVGLSTKWERREPSGSEWVFDLLKNPIRVLMREEIPGVNPRSRVSTTILHHHRGLEHRIIRVTATVEKQSGDVSLELDKETPDSY